MMKTAVVELRRLDNFVKFRRKTPGPNIGQTSAGSPWSRSTYLKKQVFVECPKCEDIFFEEDYNAFHTTCKVKIAEPRIDNAAARLRQHKGSNSPMECWGLEDGDYGCLLCSKTFASQAVYDTHWDIFHNKQQAAHHERNLVCNLCMLAFSTSKCADDHRLEHLASSSGPPTCKICAKASKTRTGLNYHLLREHSLCFLCLRRFNWSADLGRHLINDHHMDGTKVAAWCIVDARYLSARADEDAFRCPLCQATFKFKASYDSHYQFVHKDMAALTICCETCHLTFKRGSCLIQHIKQAHNGEGLVSCKRCSVESPTVFKSNKHMALKHATCYVCDKSYADFQSVRRHLVRDHKMAKDHEINMWTSTMRGSGMQAAAEAVKVLKKIPCAQCPNEFASKATYRRHVQEIHGERKKTFGPTITHWCSICQRQFKRKARVNQHMATIHKFDSWITCPKCPSRHTDEKTITVHMQYRHKVCYYCEQTFPKRDDISNHLGTVHNVKLNITNGDAETRSKE